MKNTLKTIIIITEDGIRILAVLTTILKIMQIREKANRRVTIRKRGFHLRHQIQIQICTEWEISSLELEISSIHCSHSGRTSLKTPLESLQPASHDPSRERRTRNRRSMVQDSKTLSRKVYLTDVFLI